MLAAPRSRYDNYEMQKPPRIEPRSENYEIQSLPQRGTTSAAFGDHGRMNAECKATTPLHAIP
jgi:hypothetical protein